MGLDEELDQALRRFRDTESDDARGPAFAALALAIEAKARTARITREMIVSWLGPPHLFGGRGLYVYRFDHEAAGRNRDEHYFYFDVDEKLVNSGYNRCGINDLSMLSSGSKLGEKGE